MGFFNDYFDYVDDAAEQRVCCPFPHKLTNGMPYYETKPSASVNNEKRTFHCMVCKKGHSEKTFIQEILGCNERVAFRLNEAFKGEVDKNIWEKERVFATTAHETLKAFHISEEVAQTVGIWSSTGKELKVPVFMYNRLLDIRNYCPTRDIKCLSTRGAIAGLIVPFDIWEIEDDNKFTLICAGEKDMLVARSHGFQAITITGGEGTLPVILEPFRNKRLAIVYDNDEAGKKGAVELANLLAPIAREVRNVTGFHEVCSLEKEDITDFFVKYNQTAEVLQQYILNTDQWIVQTYEKKEEKEAPLMTLLEAAQPSNVNKRVRSNIQVVATSDSTFTVPISVTMKKVKLVGKNNTLDVNDTRSWELKDGNIKDLLLLLDNNLKEKEVNGNLLELAKVARLEKGLDIDVHDSKTVFKCSVTDLFETNNKDVVPLEFVAYTVDNKLESGKKYNIEYMLVPHPFKGQQLTMIITKAVQASDSVSNFKVTPENISLLKVVQNIPGSVEDKVNTLVNKFKGILGYDGNNKLITAMDLSYHTVLEFNFGTFKNVRGYLDTFVVGESRMGKSSTAEAMRNTYQLGQFTSLAGSSATVQGLIGGSNKTTSGGYQTRAGLIPQNHRGLIILEEFGKCNSNIIKELTDIRSSNEVRITRVSGTIALPALVRMITLTNVKATDGVIKPIAAYPNGISVITELVDTAEDIARYDMLLVLGDKGAEDADPFWEPEEALSDAVYKARIRWVWSRTADQVIIDPEVGKFIIEQAKELNKTYGSHIKIFGTEAWKKLSRLSIAIAGYIVSATEDYNAIIVTKECVEYAVRFYKTIYDNSTFKLKEYVDFEKKYSEIDDTAMVELEDMYIKVPELLLNLEQCVTTNRSMLVAATGLDNDKFNKQMSRLTRGAFVRIQNGNIVPTERFRKGLARLNRNVNPTKVGDVIC